MVFLFLRLPTSFLPLEDRGMFTTSVQLPSGSTQQQTLKVVEEVEKYYFTHEKDNIMSVFPRSVQAWRERSKRGAYVCPFKRLG